MSEKDTMVRLPKPKVTRSSRVGSASLTSNIVRGDVLGTPCVTSDVVELQICGGAILVDQDTADEISHLSWHVGNDGYARRNLPRVDGRKPTERLHRRIMSAKPGEVVDHIDGNPLNNTRANLRVTTPGGNSKNITRTKRMARGDFKGVYFVKKSRRWAAHIAAGELRANGKAKLIYLGCFETKLTAAQAYDRAALFFFNEYAALNFPAERDARLIEIDLLPWGDKLYRFVLTKRENAAHRLGLLEVA